jgi:F0F1-type ATP synthase epsilon subunit
VHFSIITPTTKRTMRITFLEIETMQGNLVIELGYAPSIIMLKPLSSVLVGFANGTTEAFANITGIVQVTRTTAQLLVDV